MDCGFGLKLIPFQFQNVGVSDDSRLVDASDPDSGQDKSSQKNAQTHNAETFLGLRTGIRDDTGRVTLTLSLENVLGSKRIHSGSQCSRGSGFFVVPKQSPSAPRRKPPRPERTLVPRSHLQFTVHNPLFSILQNIVRCGDLGEGVDGAVELLARMSRGHLHADPRLALWHDRVAEADHVDAALQ